MRPRRLDARFLLAVLWLTFATGARAQQILLDRPVTAGELTLFPDLSDENVYYYVPDKPRLALDPNGRPQFSFLRYVQNLRSGPDEEELREGEGGGILHALVQLSVSEDQLREAGQELRRIAPDARIEGPVVFRSGKFALVSAFTEADGTLSRRVVGLGNAPLLDGEKAAVSLHLTKEGAKILWESFETPTPDVSFSFEMEIAGYRSPREALIEASFDQIYDHRAFQAGVASTYLAAEIKGAFDDLRREGAIKLTQVGEDEDLGGLVTTAYNKISEVMFSPLNGTGTPSLQSLTASAGGQSSGLLDRAARMLEKSRQEAGKENEAIRGRNEEKRSRNEEARKKQAAAAEARATADQLSKQLESARARAENLSERAERAEARAGKLSELLGSVEGESGEGPIVEGLRQGVQGAQKQAETFRGQAREAQAEAEKLDQQATAARAEAEQKAAAAPEEEPLEEEVAKPAFAVAAAFEMKRVRQRGTFRIDLNKYTSDSMTLRFDENIGDLRRLKDEEEHFRQANLDDPLYRQRELVAFVDGVNAEDFGGFVNFVTVQMRKQHESGQETFDEVRIDRNNFNREGNHFKLLYGYKGDDDRSDWLDYQYQTVWSFFGGATIEEPWKASRSAAINLAPPLKRKIIELDADPDTIADAQVRSITVKLFFPVGESEQTKQLTMNASREQLSDRMDILLPAGREEYDYEIVWRLRGNRTLSSERQTASTSLLFVDELPTTTGGAQ